MTVYDWLWLIADFTILFAASFLVMAIVVCIEIIKIKLQERKGKE